MTRFVDITQGLLGMEMDLHRSYAGKLGISRAQLELAFWEMSWAGEQWLA